MNKLVLCGMVAMACAMNGAAWAGSGYDHDDMDAWRDCDKKHDCDKRMMMKMGRHAMSGKVESVDHKTGWVKVKTDEGTLTVHFPPDSIKDLKDGETITVHLGYTRGEKKGEGMMDREKMDKPMKDGGMMK